MSLSYNTVVRIDCMYRSAVIRRTCGHAYDYVQRNVAGGTDTQ
jgi:hypothetical protein